MGANGVEGTQLQTEREITLTVNGVAHRVRVPVRKTLADTLRDDLGLTGTHLGCEHGVCGACTVQLDGAPVRSCLVLAVQAEGHEVRTVEGMAGPDGRLSPLQEAFWDHHALQCGYCTPGFLLTAEAFLREHPHPTEEDVREALAGNLCRCTGYQPIVAAVMDAARRLGEVQG
jgi:carbon-monoxide dehydrogenase small subunit